MQSHLRDDPRFVRVGERVSSAEMDALWRTLKQEHGQVLTLQENLARHRAREGRLARYAENVERWSVPAAGAGAQTFPRAPPMMWRPELEEIRRTLQYQQREIEQLGWECRHPQGTQTGRGTVAYHPGYHGLAAGGVQAAMALPQPLSCGLRVSISAAGAGGAQSEERLKRAPYSGLMKAEEQMMKYAAGDAARQVAWATPDQAREVGNAIVLEQMMQHNSVLRARNAMCDREAAELTRQIDGAHS